MSNSVANSFLKIFKLVSLIISVLEYFPVEVSHKAVYSSLDDKALGLPTIFAIIIIQISSSL